MGGLTGGVLAGAGSALGAAGGAVTQTTEAANAVGNAGMQSVGATADTLTQGAQLAGSGASKMASTFATNAVGAAAAPSVTSGLLNAGTQVASSLAPTASGLPSGTSTTGQILSGVGQGLMAGGEAKAKAKGDLKLQQDKQAYYRANYGSGTRGLLVGNYNNPAPDINPGGVMPTSLAAVPQEDASAPRYQYDPKLGTIVLRRITGETAIA